MSLAAGVFAGGSLYQLIQSLDHAYFELPAPSPMQNLLPDHPDDRGKHSTGTGNAGQESAEVDCTVQDIASSLELLIFWEVSESGVRGRTAGGMRACDHANPKLIHSRRTDRRTGFTTSRQLL